MMCRSIVYVVVAWVFTQCVCDGFAGVLQQAEVKKVGYFVSENVPPIAGGAAFSTQSRDALCLNLEGMAYKMMLQRVV